MGHDLLTQLGVAGLLIWLVFKEMFAFLGKRNGKRVNGSGEQSIAFWELTIGRIVEEKLKSLWAARNEDFRQIIREELENFKKN